jgi:hypothetical protein
MKYCLIILVLFSVSCSRNPFSDCNLEKVYKTNAAKVTITEGVWGTVSFMKGNCMPGSSGCSNCPTRRTVRFYEYTLMNQAVKAGMYNDFFTSFSTSLVKEIETDDKGFFQVALPPGKYTMVVLEDGKLYSNISDGQGGINPVIYNGGRQNVNFSITYQASF